MNDVEQKMNELIEAIQKSGEYVRFEQARESIHEEPGLLAKINEFRISNYKMQIGDMGKDLFDDLDRFELEFEDFMYKEPVREFLSAELGVCRMVQQIYRNIADAVDLSLDFSDEAIL